MARKPKQWKGWVLELRTGKVQVVRNVDGRLMFCDQDGQHCARPQLWITPTEARRLYTKLASDYKD